MARVKPQARVLAAMAALPFVVLVVLQLFGVHLGDNVDIRLTIVLAFIFAPALLYVAITGRVPFD